MQAELLFESLGVPALYLGRSPALTAASLGRASAIVVDLGAAATRVTAVYDGYQINSEWAPLPGVAVSLM